MTDKFKIDNFSGDPEVEDLARGYVSRLARQGATGLFFAPLVEQGNIRNGLIVKVTAPGMQEWKLASVMGLMCQELEYLGFSPIRAYDTSEGAPRGLRGYAFAQNPAVIFRRSALALAEKFAVPAYIALEGCQRGSSPAPGTNFWGSVSVN